MTGDTRMSDLPPIYFSYDSSFDWRGWFPRRAVFQYFPEQYEYIFRERDPDIVFMLCQRIWEEGAYRKVLPLRWRFGWKPVLIVVSYENLAPPHYADFSFSFNPTGGKNCAWIMPSSPSRTVYLFGGKRSEEIEKLIKTPKTRFCNFVYSDDYRETKVRRDFCKLLAQYKKVDCPGPSLNNMWRMPRETLRSDWSLKLNFLKDYKFTIAFEHTSAEHYLTEKIWHAFFTGSIPIYWGCPRVAEYFNPEAFVNCHDYRTFEDAVERVREIDNSLRLYEKYRNAPIVLPSSRLHVISRDITDHCRAITKEALRRRNEKGIKYWKLPRMILFCMSHYKISPQLIKTVCKMIYIKLRLKVAAIRQGGYPG